MVVGPVGTSVGGAVGQVAAAGAHLVAAGRDGAVLAQLARVERHAAVFVELARFIEDTLVPGAVVVFIEILASLLVGHAEALVLPQLAEALVEFVPTRQFFQARQRVVIFRLDPRLDLPGIQVFQPAIGVGHPGAEIIVRLIDGGRLGVIRRERGRADQGTGGHY